MSRARERKAGVGVWVEKKEEKERARNA